MKGGSVKSDYIATKVITHRAECGNTFKVKRLNRTANQCSIEYDRFYGFVYWFVSLCQWGQQCKS